MIGYDGKEEHDIKDEYDEKYINCHTCRHGEHNDNDCSEHARETSIHCYHDNYRWEPIPKKESITCFTVSSEKKSLFAKGDKVKSIEEGAFHYNLTGVIDTIRGQQIWIIWDDGGASTWTIENNLKKVDEDALPVKTPVESDTNPGIRTRVKVLEDKLDDECKIADGIHVGLRDKIEAQERYINTITQNVCKRIEVLEKEDKHDTALRTTVTCNKTHNILDKAFDGALCEIRDNLKDCIEKNKKKIEEQGKDWAEIHGNIHGNRKVCDERYDELSNKLEEQISKEAESYTFHNGLLSSMSCKVDKISSVLNGDFVKLEKKVEDIFDILNANQSYDIDQFKKVKADLSDCIIHNSEQRCKINKEIGERLAEHEELSRAYPHHLGSQHDFPEFKEFKEELEDIKEHLDEVISSYNIRHQDNELKIRQLQQLVRG